MTTLRVLGLIAPDGRPDPVLERLVRAEGDDRRGALREVLERFYAPVFKLDMARATKAQFHEVFRSFGTREGVTAKCEAFFIQAAQDAGVELSPYILARRHGARRPGAAPPRPRAPAADRQQFAVPAQPAPLRPSVAEMILAKYPDFDPSWAPEVQEKWLEGMARLYDSLTRPPPEEEE
jgi:hypothetical protein